MVQNEDDPIFMIIVVSSQKNGLKLVVWYGSSLLKVSCAYGMITGFTNLDMEVSIDGGRTPCQFFLFQKLKEILTRYSTLSI